MLITFFIKRMSDTSENHYWIKLDENCITYLKCLCDDNKSKTTWLKLFNIIDFGMTNEKRFKVYSTYGGNNLYIKQKQTIYWLQSDGDPETQRVPPPLDPNLNLCVG